MPWVVPSPGGPEDSGFYDPAIPYDPTNSAFNAPHDSSTETRKLTPEERALRKEENIRKNQVCKQKGPSTGDACQDARNNLQRLELCLRLRTVFTNKWYPGDESHAIENQNTSKAVENAKEAVKKACGDNCE